MHKLIYARRAVTVIAITTLALTMASSALAASAAPTAPARTIVFSQSRAGIAYIASLDANARKVDAAIPPAQALLAASAGLVADESVRTSLSTAIANAQTASAGAQRQLLSARLADDPFDRSEPGYLKLVLGGLTAATTAVTASEAQQVANIAAQKAAEARAAAAAAAAQQAAQVHAAAVARAAASIRTINVWTAGWQAQIDQCRGAVDISSYYGTPTIAEHWTCGGSAFPEGAGATVRVTGARAGTYTVVGVVAVLNAYSSNASQVPHSYNLLYQTCRGSDSRATVFIALRRQ